MKLLVYWVDMRGGYLEPQAWKTNVVDQNTGKIVGWVQSERAPDSQAVRQISLFGGKYQAEFSSNISHLECDAFAKGVEAVLNHMLEAPDEKAESNEVA